MKHYFKLNLKKLCQTFHYIKYAAQIQNIIFSGKLLPLELLMGVLIKGSHLARKVGKYRRLKRIFLSLYVFWQCGFFFKEGKRRIMIWMMQYQKQIDTLKQAIQGYTVQMLWSDLLWIHWFQFDSIDEFQIFENIGEA